MTTQTLSQLSNPLRRPLQADALVCTISGLVFTFDSEPIRALVGLDSTVFILILSLILVVYGIGLFAYTTYRIVERRLAVTVLIFNLVWIIGSVILLLADPFHFTTQGKWLVFILGDIVTVLAIWEFLSMRRIWSKV